MREGRKKRKGITVYTTQGERKIREEGKNHRNHVQEENTGRKETATVETKAGITVTSFSCKKC